MSFANRFRRHKKVIPLTVDDSKVHPLTVGDDFPALPYDFGFKDFVRGIDYGVRPKDKIIKPAESPDD